MIRVNLITFNVFLLLLLLSNFWIGKPDNTLHHFASCIAGFICAVIVIMPGQAQGQKPGQCSDRNGGRSLDNITAYFGCIRTSAHYYRFVSDCNNL